MVILDAIASVNNTNQYQLNSNNGGKSHESMSMGNEKKVRRHYPGKAIDISLSLDQSNAMGALYEANWLNAQEAILKPSSNRSKSASSSSRPECHNTPSSARNSVNEQPVKNEVIVQSSEGVKSSSLGKYQVSLDQIRALEQKDASITKTIIELNGYKPSTLRRKTRRNYPEWDDYYRSHNLDKSRHSGNSNHSGSSNDLAVLKTKSSKKLLSNGHSEDSSGSSSKGGKSKTKTSDRSYSNSSSGSSSVLEKDSLEEKPAIYSKDEASQESVTLRPGKTRLEDFSSDDQHSANGIRNTIRFCGGTIDIKDIFRRKKDRQDNSSPNNVNINRKIYPKTVNLTKNLTRDPVQLDPKLQPKFLTEKHLFHQSHPSLFHDYELVNNNNKNCDSVNNSDKQRSATIKEDHEYEVIDYSSQEYDRMKVKPEPKKTRQAVGRAKSVRINPIPDTIQQQPRVQKDEARHSFPAISKFNTLTPSALNNLNGGKNMVRRSKTIHQNSHFPDTVKERRRGESEYENIVPRRPKVVAAQPKSNGIVVVESTETRRSNNNDDDQFIIPRPRLIVPVHTYARKRRTGNLQQADTEDLKSNQEDENEGKFIGRYGLIIMILNYLKKILRYSSISN